MDMTYCPHKNVSIINGEINWAEFYPYLHSHARRLVYRFRIPYWCGQEEDVAEDVAQETAWRLIKHQQKAARGETAPIDSPKQLLVTIAHNYTLDLVRREYRLSHLSLENQMVLREQDSTICRQIEEIATENVTNEWLFRWLAREIATFPAKQRQALLIDLANRTCFDEQPTPLQAAFLAVGIDLREYQLHLPEDAVECARYSGSLYWAYLRLARFACI